MNVWKNVLLPSVLVGGIIPVGLLLLGSCKDDPPPAPAESATSASVAAPNSQARGLDQAADAGRNDLGIPTVEDFEKEAEELISSDNLESELDKLEAEIQGS